MNIGKLCYYMSYGFKSLVLKKKSPLIAGIAVNDFTITKDLSQVKSKDTADKASFKATFMNSFDVIKQNIDSLYLKGARVLYLQGGEPLLWEEEGRTINHIIEYARKRGYYHIAVVTKGMLPFSHVQSDSIWISLDGLEKTHNAIHESDVFQLIMHNIRYSTGKTIFVNMFIDRRNAFEVEALVKFVAAEEKIKALALNFKIADENELGEGENALSLMERTEIVNKVHDFKIKALPLINSHSGLEALAKNTLTESPAFESVHSGKPSELCFGQNKGLSEKALYALSAEISCIKKYKCDALNTALSYFQ